MKNSEKLPNPSGKLTDPEDFLYCYFITSNGMLYVSAYFSAGDPSDERIVRIVALMKNAVTDRGFTVDRCSFQLCAVCERIASDS